ncbi:hypothetical protein [Confluentibacter sediminis]|nr:hypothetical protein [Confluentibacter sediminis]
MLRQSYGYNSDTPLESAWKLISSSNLEYSFIKDEDVIDDESNEFISS